MRLHLVFTPMLHSAVQVRVQVPSATGGWVTLGRLHGTREQIAQLFQQLQRGAHRPDEVTCDGRFTHPAPPKRR